jgi:hypothetical protein
MTSDRTYSVVILLPRVSNSRQDLIAYYRILPSHNITKDFIKYKKEF